MIEINRQSCKPFSDECDGSDETGGEQEAIECQDGGVYTGGIGNLVGDGDAGELSLHNNHYKSWF